MNSVEFYDLAKGILSGCHRVRFRAKGGSMQPLIQNGDLLEVIPLGQKPVRLGDVLLVETNLRQVMAHRVIRIKDRNGNPAYLIKGDLLATPDGWFTAESILGRVDLLERNNKVIVLSSPAQYIMALWKVILALISLKIHAWIHSPGRRASGRLQIY